MSTVARGDGGAEGGAVVRTADSEAAAAAAGGDGASPPAARRLPSAAVQLFTLYFYLCTTPPPPPLSSVADQNEAWSEAKAVAFIDKHGGGLLDLHHAAGACNRRAEWGAAAPHALAALARLLAAGRSRCVARAASGAAGAPRAPFPPSVSPPLLRRASPLPVPRGSH
jgi:hypothetical protein